MKKTVILALATALLALSHLQAQETVRFLQVVQNGDTSRVMIEDDVNYTVKTGYADDSSLIVKIMQDDVVLKKYPASTNIYAVEEEKKQGLPVLYINTKDSEPVNGGANNKEWVLDATYTLVDGERYLQTGLTRSGKLDIKVRGNTTANEPKKPYTIRLEDGHKQSLCGMPKSRRWCLLANYLDPSMIRNSTALQMGKMFDSLRWTPGSQPVEVYLNDEYIGLYDLVEQIRIDGDRVDIPEISDAIPSGGYIIELVNSLIDEDGKWFRTYYNRNTGYDRANYEAGISTDDMGSNYTGVNIKDPDGKDGELDNLFDDIKAQVIQAEAALYSDNFKDPETGYRHYFNVASAVDLYLVNEIMRNPDTAHGSIFLYFDPASQKFVWGPIWDFDLCVGNYPYGDLPPEGWQVKSKCYWIPRMLEDPYFKNLVKARWAEKKTQLLTILDFIETEGEYIDEAITHNNERWGRGSSWAVAEFRSLLQQRIEWIDNNIGGL